MIFRQDKGLFSGKNLKFFYYFFTLTFSLERPTGVLEPRRKHSLPFKTLKCQYEQHGLREHPRLMGPPLTGTPTHGNGVSRHQHLVLG